jgi:hypothetical protein
VKRWRTWVGVVVSAAAIAWAVRGVDWGAFADALVAPVRSRRRFLPAAGAILAVGMIAAIMSALRSPARAPKVRVTSEPSGARVVLDGGTVLGYTPLEAPLPPGEHLLKFARAGYLDRTIALRGGDASAHARLYMPGELPEGMRLVDGFLIDSDAVTNRDYARFLRTVPRDAPPSWHRDLPPKGREDEPATGVSHEEATAYARWSGRRLPTIEEWKRTPGSLREWTATEGRTGFLIAGPDGAIDATSDFRSAVVGFRCAMTLEE